MEDKGTQIPVTKTDDPQAGDTPMPPQETVASSKSTEQSTAPQAMIDIAPPPQDPVTEPAMNEAMPDLAPEPVESSDVVPAPADAAAPFVAPAATDTQTNIAPAVVTPNSAHASDSPVKKGGKIMMVIVAIVLGLVLASAAVLFYLRSKEDKTADVTPPATSVKAPAVTGTDVEATSSQVDTEVSSLDENADFSSTALSDAALGLQ